MFRILAMCFSLLLVGCGDGLQNIELTGKTMGTSYSVKITGVQDSIGKDELHAQLDAMLELVNNQMSTWRADSELSRFNAYEGTDWFTVSEATAFVVSEAQRLNQLSSGALDVTVGPLVNLWGFGPEAEPVDIPSAEELATIKAKTGAQFLESRVSPPALRKKFPELRIDLSAIAKGYGVDVLADYLETLGVANYLVEIGGELRVKGLNQKGVPWRLAVEAPTPGKRSVQKVVSPGASGFATSGDYRNYYERDGKRYSHTIDPVSGEPISHTLVSVSVAHQSCMTADGLATAIMVMGPDRGFEFAKANNLAVLMMVKSGTEFVERYTVAFQPYLQEP